ncbi:MAG: sigma-54 dependent transcriptional regulator [Candidatus Omnitrophica bacterium]|nr:sigma-54 dependent transcriptional regulator [Candidatus Omnitrophota bacterium]
MNINANGYRILIVDDESLVRKSLYEVLRSEGYIASMASDGYEAMQKIEEKGFDIVITDMKMAKMDGIDLLRKIKARHADTEVIMITGYGNVETAVEAMKIGAFDYVTKPINDSEIKIIINKIIERNKLIRENISLRRKLDKNSRDRFYGLIGADTKMQKIYSMVEAIADSRATVLLTGDSGTGKRLIAQAIHAHDCLRKDKPFVEVSCGALPETLLESELFGHVKGSFTGAIKDRKGRFELADTGTIFLDEIDTFSPSLQVKLLRILQEGEFERVGDTKTNKVDVRIIAATNQPLEKIIKEGKFREDLYYRLNVISIEMPKLRDRRGDIKLLAEHFIQKHNKHANGRKITSITKQAMNILEKNEWPGNVRELENVIERAMVLSSSKEIDRDVLPEALCKSSAQAADAGKNNSLKEILEEPEKEILLRTLRDVKGNKKKAASKLGINRTTLYNKIKKYNLAVSSDEFI